MSAKDQLPIPDAVAAHPKSFEVLRVWVADHKQQISLRAGVWEDPAAWGLLLVDLARHIVNTYEPATATDRQQILNRIKLGFDAEMQCPTDSGPGR